MASRASYHETENYKWFDINLDLSDTTLDLMNDFGDATYECIKKHILEKDMTDVNVLVDVFYDIQQAIIEAGKRAEVKEVQDE